MPRASGRTTKVPLRFEGDEFVKRPSPKKAVPRRAPKALKRTSPATPPRRGFSAGTVRAPSRPGIRANTVREALVIDERKSLCDH
jgi:hypothetical protein